MQLIGFFFVYEKLENTITNMVLLYGFSVVNKAAFFLI